MRRDRQCPISELVYLVPALDSAIDLRGNVGKHIHQGRPSSSVQPEAATTVESATTEADRWRVTIPSLMKFEMLEQAADSGVYGPAANDRSSASSLANIRRISVRVSVHLCCRIFVFDREDVGLRLVTGAVRGG